MNRAIKIKLSVMMFLEYVIYGAWLPLLGLYIGKDYLNFSPGQQSWVFNAFALASLTGMFFGGQLADRYFAQEKFLAFSHLIGGLAMLGLAYQSTFWPFFGLMLLHCFFFVPTMSVTNAIVFANIKDAQKDFGAIRLWGTIGWIAASWPFIFIPIDWTKVPSMGEAGGFVPGSARRLQITQGRDPRWPRRWRSTFTVAGIASLVLAAFCLALPHTPPAKGKGESFAPFEAFKILMSAEHSRSFSSSHSIDSLVHYTYFFWSSKYLPDIGLPANWIAPAMSIGQFAEIATMAFLGLVLKKLGWRITMILGILGHVVRFGVYSIGTPDLLWLVILSNVVAWLLRMPSSSPPFTSMWMRISPRTMLSCSTCYLGFGPSEQLLSNLLITWRFRHPLASNFLSGVSAQGLHEGEQDRVPSSFPRPSRVGVVGGGNPGDLFPPREEGPGSRRGSRPCPLSGS